MGNEPLVSIIIPVYNGANYMRYAIDSALGQTYSNIEVIVVNDGSSDSGETEKIALSYGDKIKYFYKENGGVSSALNYGIKHMNGTYFSWLSHDDMYTKDKIKNQVDALDNDKNSIVLCNARHINKVGDIIGPSKKRKNLAYGKNTWNTALENVISYGSFNGCALLIPKETLLSCGGFDESLKYCQDVLMWINLFLKRRGLIYIEECDVFNRIHDRQLTQTGSKLFYAESKSIADYIINELSKTEYAAKLLYAYMLHNAVLNNQDVVCKCFKKNKKENFLSVHQLIIVSSAKLYGKVRPTLKRLYYRIFRNV